MEVGILKNEKNELEFEVNCDPSIPELIVSKLNENDAVVFASYKITHPIRSRPRIIVKTEGKNALDITLKTLEGISDEISDFKKAFKKAK